MCHNMRGNMLPWSSRVLCKGCGVWQWCTKEQTGAIICAVDVSNNNISHDLKFAFFSTARNAVKCFS